MGRDKALIRIDGVTLIERAVRRLGQACDPVLIAPGARHIDVPGFVSVDDAVPGVGPLGGLVAALHASRHPLLAAVAVDMPWFDPILLRLLAEGIAGHEACVPVTDRGPEPLHAVYARASVTAGDAALSGTDHSLRGLLSRVRVRYVSEDEWRRAGVSPGFASNLNTPDDLARLMAARIP
jgi:molybdenum cofactor guanylyltransferase